MRKSFVAKSLSHRPTIRTFLAESCSDTPDIRTSEHIRYSVVRIVRRRVCQEGSDVRMFGCSRHPNIRTFLARSCSDNPDIGTCEHIRSSLVLVRTRVCQECSDVRMLQTSELPDPPYMRICKHSQHGIVWNARTRVYQECSDVRMLPACIDQAPSHGRPFRDSIHLAVRVRNCVRNTHLSPFSLQCVQATFPPGFVP